MSTRLGTKTGVASIGRKSAAHRFVLTWERASYVVDGESESTSTAGDAVFDVYASATVDHEAIVNVEPFGPDVPGPVVFTSSDTAVATVDETGRVSRVANGYVRITAANAAGYVAASSVIPIARESSAVSVFSHFVTGSLARYIADSIDTAIAGASLADASLFSSYTYGAGGTRNPTAWTTLAGCDTSCIAVNRPNTLLIGSDIGLQVEHYPASSATFVAMYGDTATRAIVGGINIGPANAEDGWLTDLRIVRLSSPLPAKFKPALLPPADIRSYLPSTANRVPVMTGDQQKRMNVADIFSYAERFACRVPIDSQRLVMYQPKDLGDSGCNAFLPPLPDDDRPIVATAWSFGFAGGGPNIANVLAEIEAATQSLGCSGELAIADLSAFPTYGD